MSEEEKYRRFPETHETMTAEELYEEVFLTFGNPRNEVYLSRPLSGGGHK